MYLIVALTALALYLFVTRRRLTKAYIFWSLLLVLYLTVALMDVVGFPTLAEWERMQRLGKSLFQPDVNWLPFSAGFDFSSSLNIVFFIPLGVALPVLWRRFTSLKATIIYGFGFSLLIEIAQLFTLHRQTDVNDLLMNTLGTLLGWLLVTKVFGWSATPQDDGENFDWVIYPTIAILSCFFF